MHNGRIGYSTKSIVHFDKYCIFENENYLKISLGTQIFPLYTDPPNPFPEYLFSMNILFPEYLYSLNTFIPLLLFFHYCGIFCTKKKIITLLFH